MTFSPANSKDVPTTSLEAPSAQQDSTDVPTTSLEACRLHQMSLYQWTPISPAYLKDVPQHQWSPIRLQQKPLKYQQMRQNVYKFVTKLGFSKQIIIH